MARHVEGDQTRGDTYIPVNVGFATRLRSVSAESHEIAIARGNARLEGFRRRIDILIRCLYVCFGVFDLYACTFMRLLKA